MTIRDKVLKNLAQSTRVSELRVAEDASGETSSFTWLEVHEDLLGIRNENEKTVYFPCTYLEAIMRRYGNQLSVCGDFISHLQLPDGKKNYLGHMLFVPDFDVVPKDYLVWLPETGPPLFELNALLLPPLRHLVGALKNKTPTRVTKVH